MNLSDYPSGINLANTDIDLNMTNGGIRSIISPNKL